MTDWTKEEQAAHRAHWIKALRSGDYKQGRGALVQKYGQVTQFCCLGVAMECYT